ncbi:unnamed protein product [Fraxinus pennsylvanica]|uniref:Uncharacterized protein n=1 Tax=Fraxinus pennsylvanica TaxID=56036 RepID=A0AAD2E776_9LAMI|nr:unnamed protein product [Fraxinus pennsylvanica]
MLATAGFLPFGTLTSNLIEVTESTSRIWDDGPVAVLIMKMLFGELVKFEKEPVDKFTWLENTAIEMGFIGGEIELGYLQGADREFGALGFVEDVEAGAANGDEDGSRRSDKFFITATTNATPS